MIDKEKLMDLLNQNDEEEKQFYKEYCSKGGNENVLNSTDGGYGQVAESYNLFPDMEQIEARLQVSRRDK